MFSDDAVQCSNKLKNTKIENAHFTFLAFANISNVKRLGKLFAMVSLFLQVINFGNIIFKLFCLFNMLIRIKKTRLHYRNIIATGGEGDRFRLR